MLKIYLSNYALLRANIKISFNSLSTQQLRNMQGIGEAGLRFSICLGETHMGNSNSAVKAQLSGSWGWPETLQSGCLIVYTRREQSYCS